MGFYGTLTSSAKTNLQIDKHYNNRVDMEKGALVGDGVYAGRYVLVEYSQSKSLSDFPQLYERNGKFYSSPDITTEITTFVESEIYKVIPYADWNKTIVPSSYIYIMYVGIKQDNGTIALIKATTASDKTGFTNNFLIDQAAYAPNNSAFKGYDSTVWQKIYENGKATYINIAELNSVIPTFGIKVDAPTEKPRAPHFDQNNTNIYYDVHLQPSWGFRVAAADAATGTTTNNKNDNWDSSHDDEKTNQAIYYNKKGFEEYTANTKVTDKDFITVKPTGISGYKYNISETLGENKVAVKEDIQELRLSLPSIGNMVSAGWDIIHGPARDDDSTNSLQGRVNFFKNELAANEIPVQSTGKYLVGATMSDDNWIATKIDAANKNISITHTFTAVTDTTSSSNKNGNGDTIALYTPHVDEKGHVVGKNIETVTLPYGFKTIKPGNSSTAVVNGTENTTQIVADSTQDTLNVNPSNKWINVAGNNSSDTLSIGHEVNTITTTNKDDTNLDGIGNFTVQDLIFDEAGHVTANQTHKYILPFSFRNITIGEASSAITKGISESATINADTYNDTVVINPENRWITLNGIADNDTFSIGHAAAGNEAHTAGDTSAITTPAFGSSFNTTVVKYDEMGHISKVGTRSVTFPIGSFNNPTPTGTTSNVLTSFEYTPSSGAITVNNRNLSSLLLTGYTATKTDSSYVQATDSLAQGINKIENRLDTTNTTINGRIDNEVQSLNTTITNNVSTLNGRIDTEVQTLNTRVDNEVNTLNKRIDTEVNTLNTLIEDEAKRATAAEEALGKRIDGILDGITEEELNTFKELSDALGDDANFAANVNKAIAANTSLINAESTRAQQAETANANAINTEKTRAEGQEQAIREEFAAADETNGKAIAAVSALVGETSVSDQINTKLVNYYTSETVDTKLTNYITADSLTTTLDNYYTAEEINNTFNNYSTSTIIAENYYNKSEIDATLQNYITVEQIPTDFYPKAEVDALISELQAQITELKALIESYHPVTEEPTPEEEIPAE